MSLWSKVMGKRSLYLELLDEEASLPKGARDAFASVEDLMKGLGARADLVKRMDAAKASGQLTQQEYDNLVALNRQHS